MRGWKNISLTNGKQNKSEEAIPVSDKIDFKTKTLIRLKEENCL